MSPVDALRASAAEHAYRATYFDGVIRRAPTLTLAGFGDELAACEAAQTRLRRLGREIVIEVWITASPDQPRGDAQGAGATILDAFVDLARRLADWHREQSRACLAQADGESAETISLAVAS